MSYAVTDYSRGLPSRFEFLQAFLQWPREVASVHPSSRYLERRLASIAETRRARFVVELGPGNGGTTRALLRELPLNATILAIEIVPSFASSLVALSDPRVLVHEGDAVELQSILGSRNMPMPDRIVSGVPISTLQSQEARRLMEQIHALLASGGCFIAYQFRDEIDHLARPYFGAPDVFREYRNIPPLRIYRWRKGSPT